MAYNYRIVAFTAAGDALPSDPLTLTTPGFRGLELSGRITIVWEATPGRRYPAALQKSPGRGGLARKWHVVEATGPRAQGKCHRPRSECCRRTLLPCRSTSGQAMSRRARRVSLETRETRPTWPSRLFSSPQLAAWPDSAFFRMPAKVLAKPSGVVPPIVLPMDLPSLSRN